MSEQTDLNLILDGIEEAPFKCKSNEEVIELCEDVYPKLVKALRHAIEAYSEVEHPSMVRELERQLTAILQPSSEPKEKEKD